MVDDESIFTKEGTVARSSQDIVRFFYLQALERVLAAQKNFYVTRKESAAFEAVKREWSASLRSLLFLCEPRIRGKGSKKKDYAFDFDGLIGKIDDESKFNELTSSLVSYLEIDLKITDISKVDEFDRTNPFLANRMQGYK